MATRLELHEADSIASIGNSPIATLGQTRSYATFYQLLQSFHLSKQASRLTRCERKQSPAPIIFCATRISCHLRSQARYYPLCLPGQVRGKNRYHGLAGQSTPAPVQRGWQGMESGWDQRCWTEICRVGAEGFHALLVLFQCCTSARSEIKLR